MQQIFENYFIEPPFLLLQGYRGNPLFDVLRLLYSAAPSKLIDMFSNLSQVKHFFSIRLSGYSLLAPINTELKLVWYGKGVMPFCFSKHTKNNLMFAENQ